MQFFYEFKNAVNLCVLFRSRGLAQRAVTTWGDYGKAKVVGFPPRKVMEMEAWGLEIRGFPSKNI